MTSSCTLRELEPHLNNTPGLSHQLHVLGPIFTLSISKLFFALKYVSSLTTLPANSIERLERHKEVKGHHGGLQFWRV